MIRSRFCDASEEPRFVISKWTNLSERSKHTTLQQSLLLLLWALPEYLSLDLLCFCALDHPLNVNTLQMDVFWCNLAIPNDLICLHNRHLRVLAHSLVEVILRLAELAITEPICLCDLDECVIAEDRFFHDV
jgi:hypothetical protein